MTCIVGLKTKNKIYVGGDSAGVAGLNLSIRADPKIFKKDKFVMGFTTSFRMGQLLRFEFKPPIQNEKETDLEYMCCDFIKAVRECLEAGGFSKITDNVEKGGTFIVGYKSNLYKIYNDFQIETVIDDYMACGCGEDFALGVLRVTSKLMPRKRISLALEAAEYFCAGVRRPFKILELRSE